LSHQERKLKGKQVQHKKKTEPKKKLKKVVFFKFFHNYFCFCFHPAGNKQKQKQRFNDEEGITQYLTLPLLPLRHLVMHFD